MTTQQNYLKVETSTVWGTLKFSIVDAKDAMSKIATIRAYGLEIKRWESPNKPMAVSIAPASIGEIFYFGGDVDVLVSSYELVELI